MNKRAIRVLFVGNSATYVNDLPRMLQRLACEAGYYADVNMVVKSGAWMTAHADASTDHGKAVLAEIAKGYDIVFLQENSSCISSEENKAKTENAAKILNDAIREAGSLTYFYVRPPTGKDLAGYNSYTQCVEYDKLFEKLADEIGATNAYVNRAFAYSIVNNPEINLWGADNAHTGPCGAYLAVCVFFATVFDTSSAVLGSNGLPDNVAHALQTAADAAVFNSFVP